MRGEGLGFGVQGVGFRVEGIGPTASLKPMLSISSACRKEGSGGGRVQETRPSKIVREGFKRRQNPNLKTQNPKTPNLKNSKPPKPPKPKTPESNIQPPRPMNFTAAKGLGNFGEK